MANKGRWVLPGAMEHPEYKARRVNVVHLVQRENEGIQVTQVPKVLLDAPDHLDPKAFKATPVRVVVKDLKDLRALQVEMERSVPQVHRVLVVNILTIEVRRVIRVIRVTRVTRVMQAL